MKSLLAAALIEGSCEKVVYCRYYKDLSSHFDQFSAKTMQPAQALSTTVQ